MVAQAQKPASVCVHMRMERIHRSDVFPGPVLPPHCPTVGSNVRQGILWCGPSFLLSQLRSPDVRVVSVQ